MQMYVNTATGDSSFGVDNTFISMYSKSYPFDQMALLHAEHEP